jgi:hypothetical protein
MASRRASTLGVRFTEIFSVRVSSMCSSLLHSADTLGPTICGIVRGNRTSGTPWPGGWRYDLAPLGPSETEVRLSYDWSAVPEEVRQQGQFPPFSPDHLDNSLTRLAELVVA